MDRVRGVWQWPLRARIGAVLGVLALAVVGKLLEDPAIAFRDWMGAVLSGQFSFLGWHIVLVFLAGLILGMLIAAVLPKSGLTSVAPTPVPEAVSAQQTLSPAQQAPFPAQRTPQQQAAADLDELLNEMATGNSQFLSTFLGRLELLFNRLGFADDAAWCQAEQNGYQRDTVPAYRYADATRQWRSGGVTNSAAMNQRPADVAERIPLNQPVGALIRSSQAGLRETTGQRMRSTIGAELREQIVVGPDEVQGVLRRIQQEASRKALAARNAQDLL